jgi:hypothetical protein
MPANAILSAVDHNLGLVFAWLSSAVAVFGSVLL